MTYTHVYRDDRGDTRVVTNTTLRPKAAQMPGDVYLATFNRLAKALTFCAHTGLTSGLRVIEVLPP